MVDGERIRYLRYDKGIDFHALATAAGISRNTLNRLERGLTKRPTASVLKRVATALSVETSELMAGAGDRVPSPFPLRIDTAEVTEEVLARLKARWLAEAKGVVDV